MAVIVLGVCLASVYGPKDETSPTMAEMARLAQQPVFLCCLAYTPFLLLLG